MAQPSQELPKLPGGFDKKIGLVLQGGGALGSYQAGVYEGLSESPYLPDWVAGISIGAINAAIIAGNAPEHRVAKLRAFWDEITAPTSFWLNAHNEVLEAMQHRLGAINALFFGQPGFFRPRPPSSLIGQTQETSYYDTAELKTTLERLVDFDRINARHIRLSVGAVNVRTGNFIYFDNMTHVIRPEHIMASGALPPGFPPIEIDGEFYWDGGLVSNTPLHYILSATPRESRLSFQVDVFPARGKVPTTLDEVSEREKDVRYSSRTRMGTLSFQAMHEVRNHVSILLKKLPKELLDEPEVKFLRNYACQTRMDIVQLIYRPATPQGSYKDFEFSHVTMANRWNLGLQNMRQTLAQAPWLAPEIPGIGVRLFDVCRPALTRREQKHEPGTGEGLTKSELGKMQEVPDSPKPEHRQGEDAADMRILRTYEKAVS